MSAAPLYLSRARLRRRAPAAALRALLLPRSPGRRAGAGHRLVWTLFGDHEERERDFLWREADAGEFYLLSRREPEDRHELFDLDPPKPFAPSFAVGDRLAFSLRANATVARWDGTRGVRGKPVDVVMAAIAQVPQAERAAARVVAIQAEGRRWLEAQGARCGFVIPDAAGDAESWEDDDEDVGARATVRVTGYRTLRVDHRGPSARIGVLDLEGILEVRDPAAFVAALGRGFGRAKAFGCGLMLVRRA